MQKYETGFVKRFTYRHSLHTHRIERVSRDCSMWVNAFDAISRIASRVAFSDLSAENIAPELGPVIETVVRCGWIKVDFVSFGQRWWRDWSLTVDSRFWYSAQRAPEKASRRTVNIRSASLAGRGGNKAGKTAKRPR